MNINNLYLKPTPSATDESLTVSTGVVSFVSATTYAAATTAIVLNVKGADAMCTFDGSAPSATNGHRLVSGTHYTWSKAAAAVAKFIRQDATDAVIHASQFTS